MLAKAEDQVCTVAELCTHSRGYVYNSEGLNVYISRLIAPVFLALTSLILGD